MRPRAVLLCLLASTGCGHSKERGAGAQDGGTEDGGADAGAGACRGGAFRCEGDFAISCDPGAVRQDCASQGRRCIDGPGCAECTPGQRACANGAATFCRDDGTLAHYACDPVQGLSCTPSGCLGECDLSQVHDSYIGCDYYPTVTLNPVWSQFNFAVAVSNTSAQTTKVTITRGDTVVQEAMVAANQLQTFELPWVDELKGGDIACTLPPPPGVSRVLGAGAYRVRSDRPVTVYQFSPLQYEITPAPATCPTVRGQCADSIVDQCFSYSNDASLLLPATALTGSYTVLAWPSQANGAGFIAVTATEDATKVQVFGAGSLAAGGGLDASGGAITLDRGGVLELVAASSSDVSGTRIRADKPVQVLSGHSCANVPTADVEACDHLEEVVFPEDTLGSEYVLTRPVFSDGTTALPYVARIAAIAADTHVHFDPAVHEDALLAAGQMLELSLSDDAHVQSDKPVVVAIYMEGQAALRAALGGDVWVGDPSLSTAVPVAQYRNSYLFTAPLTYSANIATIIAKPDAMVRLDGSALPASQFSPVGGGAYAVANVLLEGSSAVHTLDADQEIGLTVYGYGQYTSYMYPGGADLARITIPPLL